MIYDCPICKNEGYIYYKGEDGNDYAKECECNKIRRTLYNAQNSGLGELLNIYTFDRFKTDYEFQKDLYNKAQQFLKENNKWFTVLGKSGSGKTFICTAICKELLNQGKEVRLMNWIDESRKLKQRIADKDYDEIIDPFKNAEVLYIDDFFKAENNSVPTNADIKLANEIIWYRYNKALSIGSGYQTIISSERTLQQLVSYDEALTGRIVQMSDNYIKVLKENTINYRLQKYL